MERAFHLKHIFTFGKPLQKLISAKFLDSNPQYTLLKNENL